jgi:hypothetical protein
MCLIICFLLGSLHRRTVRASVIVDREQGEAVQQQTDILRCLVAGLHASLCENEEAGARHMRENQKRFARRRSKRFSPRPALTGARRLVVRAVVMVRLRVVRLRMVPHRSVPAILMHIGERHRGGRERGYDEDSKSLLENGFHVNPGGR